MWQSRLRTSAGDLHPRECFQAEIPRTKSFPVPTRSIFLRQDRAESFCFTASATLRKRSRFSRMNFTLQVSEFALQCCQVTTIVEDL